MSDEQYVPSDGEIHEAYVMNGDGLDFKSAAERRRGEFDEWFAPLKDHSETLAYIQSSLIGASIAQSSQPAYRALAGALLCMMPDGTDVRERMDRMQAYMSEHHQDFR